MERSKLVHGSLDRSRDSGDRLPSVEHDGLGERSRARVRIGPERCHLGLGGEPYAGPGVPGAVVISPVAAGPV